MTPPAIRNSVAPLQSVAEESRSHRVAEIGLKAFRSGKDQPGTDGPTKTRDNEMAKVKLQKVANRNQGNMA